MDKEVVDEGKVTEQAPEKSAETQKSDNELTIPKSRLDEVIAQRDEARKKVETAEHAQTKATKDALAEQGKFKELYENQLEEAEKARAELDTIRVESVKRDVATNAGYPLFWDRITGETQNELEADMAKLVEVLPKVRAPNIDGGTKSGNRSADNSKPEDKTDAEKLYLANVLGVPVKYVK